MAGEVVVVVVTITKVNGHTRVNAEDVEHIGYVAIQINVCGLMTMETHPTTTIRIDRTLDSRIGRIGVLRLNTNLGNTLM